MAEVLGFSRRETAFAPETIEILAVALEETWERLQKIGQSTDQACLFAGDARGDRQTHRRNGAVWCPRPRGFSHRCYSIHSHQLRATERTRYIGRLDFWQVATLSPSTAIHNGSKGTLAGSHASEGAHARLKY